MTRDTVLYAGRFRFPDGDAGAHRVLAVGEALRESGMSVVFAGTAAPGRAADLRDDGTYAYRGFQYIPEPTNVLRRCGRTFRFVSYHSSGAGVVEWATAFDPARLRAVIIYNGTNLLLWRFMRFGQRWGVPIIADVPEWFEPCQITGGRLNPTWLGSEVRMRLTHARIGRVIAISSYLRDYYTRRGCKVVYVPPLADVADLSRYWRCDCGIREKTAPLHLAYAGEPGKKDLLGDVVRALELLGSDSRGVRLSLIGPTAADLRCALGGQRGLLERLRGVVTCYGRKPHEAAMEMVASADFTILLRPDTRFTRAGFPSKFAESMALGVPVVANLTGDLAHYLRDGREGVVLDAPTPQACCSGIRRLLLMPRERWASMREGARRRAEESFSYRRYVQPLSEFLGSCVR